MALGAPGCASVRHYRGKAYLGWYYSGLFVFRDGSPRRAFAIRVLPNALVTVVCQ